MAERDLGEASTWSYLDCKTILEAYYSGSFLCRVLTPNFQYIKIPHPQRIYRMVAITAAVDLRSHALHPADIRLTTLTEG